MGTEPPQRSAEPWKPKTAGTPRTAATGTPAPYGWTPLVVLALVALVDQIEANITSAADDKPRTMVWIASTV